MLDGTDHMMDINSRIAARVRDLRAAANLSLEALARRSDVSRSMLSLVERGETSPSAVVLEKIATGLKCTLAALFDDSHAPASPISRGAERVSWKDPQSGYVRRNIRRPTSPRPFASWKSHSRPARAFPMNPAHAIPEWRSRSGYGRAQSKSLSTR